MRDYPTPFVSIITVNFNGIFFLKTLFDSIAGLDYPKEKIQVIMVDNNSTDGSISFVKSKYPFVEIIKINKNLGFAGGNNEGVKAARGEYIAFINNDCAVEKDWLLGLVSVLTEKERQGIKVGGAGSKVLFYFKYLPLRISFEGAKGSPGDEKGEEFEALIKGFKIKEADNGFMQNEPEGSSSYKKSLLGFANKSFKYPEGFYDFGRDKDKNIIRKVKDNAVIRVPVVDTGRDIELEFMISFMKPPTNFKLTVKNDNSGETLEFSLCAAEEKSGQRNADNPGPASPGEIAGIKADLQDGPGFLKAELRIPAGKYIYSQSIINSCGSMINKAFYAREINYECVDDKTCVKPFEVFALPGSSFIINRKLALETGLFDEEFFTYYEDIDLFWRAALKGWRFFAAPGSVARHFHCGSGEEWSYSFTYHVLRNRLLMIYRCCWFLGFLKNYLSFCAAAFINLLYLAASKAMRRELNRPDILIRVKIFFEFFILMASHLGKRIKIRTGSAAGDKSIKKWQQDF